MIGLITVYVYTCIRVLSVDRVDGQVSVRYCVNVVRLRVSLGW